MILFKKCIRSVCNDKRLILKMVPPKLHTRSLSTIARPGNNGKKDRAFIDSIILYLGPYDLS